MKLKTEFNSKTRRFVRQISSGDIVYRARSTKSNVKIEKSADISAPPIERAIYANRMSPAGISFFYGALDKETAISEIYSNEMDNKDKVVHIGIFEALKDFKVYDLTHEPLFPGLFDMDVDDRSTVLFLRSFRKQISMPVIKENTEHIEYVPTQILTEYLMA